MQINGILKLNLTCQGQSTPKTIGTLTMGFRSSGPHLVGLPWMKDQLSRGKAQNGVNFDFEINLTLKVKANYPPKQ